MRNQVRTYVLSIGISALLGGALLAGEYNIEKAKIPFGFHLNDTALPAGDYVVKDTGISGVLQIRDEQTGKSIVVMTKSRTTGKNDAPRLVFHRIGDQYFLSQVWMLGSDGLNLHKGKLEREMENGGKEIALASVPLARQ